jgi:hypothetical protein
MLSHPAFEPLPPLQMRQSEVAVFGMICIELHPLLAAHSTRHACPAAHVIEIDLQASGWLQSTTHGFPAGHVTPELHAVPVQMIRHAPFRQSVQPLGHVPPSPLASFAASCGASAGASSLASFEPLEPLDPLEPLEPLEDPFVPSAASAVPLPARISLEVPSPLSHAPTMTSAPIAATKPKRKRPRTIEA